MNLLGPDAVEFVFHVAREQTTLYAPKLGDPPDPAEVGRLGVALIESVVAWAAGYGAWLQWKAD